MINNINNDSDEDKRYNKFTEDLEKVSNKGYAIAECINLFFIRIPTYFYNKYYDDTKNK